MSGEDYIIHPIFEWVLVMFIPASGKLSGVWTRKHYIILYELLNEYYNINSIYTMNLRRLSLYVLIDPWIHCPSYWKAACVHFIWCPTVWPNVENGFGIENGFFIGDWISINFFGFVQSVGWKVRKYQYWLISVQSCLSMSDAS